MCKLGSCNSSFSHQTFFASTVSTFSPCFSSSGLSSELQVDIDTEDLYLKFDRNILKPVSLSKSFTELTFNDTEVTVALVLNIAFFLASSSLLSTVYRKIPVKIRECSQKLVGGGGGGGE